MAFCQNDNFSSKRKTVLKEEEALGCNINKHAKYLHIYEAFLAADNFVYITDL